MSHAQIPTLHLIWLWLVLSLAGVESGSVAGVGAGRVASVEAGSVATKAVCTRGQNIMSWTLCTFLCLWLSRQAAWLTKWTWLHYSKAKML